jgi:hypothetical protein
MSPDKNTRDVEELLQLAYFATLEAIACGRIDVVQIARQAIASRGLDMSGKWIGFAAANKLMQQESA